ncbi:MAG TPA: hypothetical protein P5328_00725 [Candidatus Paceibacterota bacterium]|nr:hypothetical protein [Candidatus Paceibacterota bacterium]HRZ34514.1 hypothetical protein [Candidatus Paceibacterota bacterium]
MVGKDKIIDLPIAPEFLWFILAFLIILFIAIYLILIYHWKSYGLEHNPRIFARTIFWIIAIVLILIMAFSITGFEYS